MHPVLQAFRVTISPLIRLRKSRLFSQKTGSKPDAPIKAFVRNNIERVEGNVAANPYTWLHALIYQENGCTTRREEHAWLLKSRVSHASAQGFVHPEDPDTPQDLPQLYPALLHAVNEAFRSYIPHRRSHETRLMQHVSLDGGIAASGSGDGHSTASDPNRHTIRANFLFDGCRTLSDIQERGAAVKGMLGGLQSEGWAVAEASATGAFQLGDYVHLRKAGTRRDASEARQAVFLRDAQPAEHELKCAQQHGDFLASVMSTPDRIAVRSQPFLQSCSKMLFVGPVGRDTDGRVTHYGSLTWTAAGKPVLSFSAIHMDSSRVAANVQTRRIRRGKRLGFPFQPGQPAKKKNQSITVLKQPLEHDPFKRLPQCSFLTWRCFNIMAHWRGPRSLIFDVMPLLPVPDAHPLHIWTLHLYRDVDMHRSFSHHFFNMPKTQAEDLIKLIRSVGLHGRTWQLANYGDEDVRRLDSQRQRARVAAGRALGYADRGMIDTLVSRKRFEEHVNEVCSSQWHLVRPKGLQFQSLFGKEHTLESEPDESTGSWVDDFFDIARTLQGTKGNARHDNSAFAAELAANSGSEDLCPASMLPHFVYRLNKRVAAFAMEPQALGAQQAQWLKERARELQDEAAKQDEKNKNIDNNKNNKNNKNDTARGTAVAFSRLFRLWGCDQLLPLEGFQYPFGTAVLGVDAPKLAPGTALELPLPGSPPNMQGFQDLKTLVEVPGSKPGQLFKDQVEADLRAFHAGRDPAPKVLAVKTPAGSTWYPHFGIFPAVTPPDWDVSSAAESEQLWTMELTFKSMWNGCNSIDDMLAMTESHLSLLENLGKEDWRLARPVENGRIVLQCPGPRVAARGCITQHVGFGVWPEIRRVPERCHDWADELDKGEGDIGVQIQQKFEFAAQRFAADHSLPYTEVDVKLLQSHGLLAPAELDDMLTMQEGAKMAALGKLADVFAAVKDRYGIGIELDEEKNVLRIKKRPSERK